MADLRFWSISRYKNFTRCAKILSYYLNQFLLQFNLIIEQIAKRDIIFRKAIYIKKRFALIQKYVAVVKCHLNMFTL